MKIRLHYEDGSEEEIDIAKSDDPEAEEAHARKVFDDLKANFPFLFHGDRNPLDDPDWK